MGERIIKITIMNGTSTLRIAYGSDRSQFLTIDPAGVTTTYTRPIAIAEQESQQGIVLNCSPQQLISTVKSSKHQSLSFHETADMVNSLCLGLHKVSGHSIQQTHKTSSLPISSAWHRQLGRCRQSGAALELKGKTISCVEAQDIQEAPTKDGLNGNQGKEANL